MSADLRGYQTAEGLSDAQMAERLTDALGRTISEVGYRTVKSRKGAPDEWLQALGIAPQEPTDDDLGAARAAADAPPADAPDMNAARERAPHAAPVAGVLPFEPATAQMQITLIYTMAGKGAAIAMRSPAVADIWAQHAPQIAAAYIEWARYNPTVANYIRAITLGGPAGQLVLLHGSLLVTTLITSGRLNPEQFVPPIGDATDLINEPPADEQGVDDGDTGPAKPRTRKRRTPAA